MLFSATLVTVILLTHLELCLCASTCKEDTDCGFSGICNNGLCACTVEWHLHANGIDCRNNACQGADCLDCEEHDKKACTRCVHFLHENTKQCLTNCSTLVENREDGTLMCKDHCTIRDCVQCLPDGSCFKCKKFLSLPTGLCVTSCFDTDMLVRTKERAICKETNMSTKDDIIISIVGGVSCGLFLIIIFGTGTCYYIRKTRKKINLQAKNYKSRQMEMGKLRQIPHYDNKAFELDDALDVQAGVVAPQVYVERLEQLRPHTDTLMAVLSDIRRKLRRMDPADPRVPTYKGVIHQLCRVLVLLHKKDPTASIPSDALGLIEWAQQMLEDHREQEEHSSMNNQDCPVNRISYIDVDVDKLNSHVYATPTPPTANPNILVQEPSSARHTSGYYSSVPVPLEVNLNNTYATINRSPANPVFHGNKNLNNTAKLWSFKKVNNTCNVRTENNISRAYFANGRYYDPNPQAEVYVPASSYSDRSAGPLSTFIGDRPRSGSLSSNTASNGDENVDDLDEEYDDGEGLPFDPRDATEPVEV